MSATPDLPSPARSRVPERLAPWLDRDLVVRSEAMASVLAELDLVVPFRRRVLLLGPTGTGKTTLAALLHRARRLTGRFVTLDCTRYPDELFPAELFGCEAGAYTGAERRRRGLLAEAHGGTLFLEEVGDLSPHNQARLLSFLDEGRYRPLGGGAEQTATVLVVAATSRDLSDAATFRRELLHRLADVPLRVPPLSERADDIVPLAQAVLHGFAREHGRRPLGLELGACHWLLARTWPGNIRELRSRVERAGIRAYGEGAPRVDERHLDPAASDGGGAALPPLSALERAFRRAVFQHHLEAAGGRRSEAIRTLGVPRSTFYHQLEQLGLQDYAR